MHIIFFVCVGGGNVCRRRSFIAESSSAMRDDDEEQEKTKFVPSLLIFPVSRISPTFRANAHASACSDALSRGLARRLFSYKIDVDIRLLLHIAVWMSQERRLSSTSAFFPSPRLKTSDREVEYPRSSKAVGIS